MSTTMKGSEVRARLGVSDKTLRKLPLNKVNVAPPGARRPTWRYNRAEVEAFCTSRTVAPGHTLEEVAPDA